MVSYYFTEHHIIAYFLTKFRIIHTTILSILLLVKPLGLYHEKFFLYPSIQSLLNHCISLNHCITLLHLHMYLNLSFSFHRIPKCIKIPTIHQIPFLCSLLPSLTYLLPQWYIFVKLT